MHQMMQILSQEDRRGFQATQEHTLADSIVCQDYSVTLSWTMVAPLISYVRNYSSKNVDCNSFFVSFFLYFSTAGLVHKHIFIV